MRMCLAMLLAFVLAAPLSAQVPTGMPRTTAIDNQRMADLASIVEGQNTLQARRTAARELLRQAWPDTPARLAAILSGSNRPARIAVSQALTDSREFLDDRYIEPLVLMLADAEPELRQAAAAALATYASSAVVQRLERLLSEAETSQLCKLAAIDALGNMTQPAALGVLLALTSDSASPLCRPALAALERATAQDFSNDPQKALDWWRGAQEKNPSDWQQLQIERLVRQANGLSLRARELESRLLAAVREGYLRLPDADRTTHLIGMLADPIDVVRILGLDLVQGQLTEGKTPQPELVTRCRGLMSAAEPRVRAAAIRTISALRDKADADTFRKMLADETAAEVRAALVGGLGYCGGPESTQTLIPLISGEDPLLAEEGVASIGRLAERGELDGADREAAIGAILSRPTFATPKNPASRERELRSLSKLGDARVAPRLFAAIDAKEPSPVRVAAIRGLAALALATNGNAAYPTSTSPATNVAATTSTPVSLRHGVADALVTLLSDGDIQVRRAAIEGLSILADADSHLQAIWARLSPSIEPDEALRTQAWKAVMGYLGGRPIREIQIVAERKVDNEPLSPLRRLDLEQLLEKALLGDPKQRAALGLSRARIAALRAELNQVTESIVAYQVALESLGAVRAAELSKVATEFLRFALLNDRYDQQVASELKPERIELDIGEQWKVTCDAADFRLKRDGPAPVIAMLSAFRTSPPAPLAEEIQRQLDARLTALKRLQEGADSDPVQKALALLRAEPGSQAARDVIVGMGPRVLPGLRRELMAEITSPTNNPQFEAALCELAKALQPGWLGIPANASVADKIKAAEALEG